MLILLTASGSRNQYWPISNGFACISTILPPSCSPFSWLSNDPTINEFHPVLVELCSFYWRFWQQKPTLADVERFRMHFHGSTTVLFAFFTAFRRSNSRRILSSSCRAIIILLTTSNIRSQHRPISNDFVRISTVLPPSCSHFSLLLDDPTIKEFHAVFVELSSVYWLLLTSETNIGRSQMIVHAFPRFYHHPARPSLRFQTIQQLTNFIQWLQRYSHFTVWGQFDSYLGSLVCRPSTFAIYLKPFFITLIWHLDHSIWSSGCRDIHIFVKISIFNLSLWLGVILMWI